MKPRPSMTRSLLILCLPLLMLVGIGITFEEQANLLVLSSMTASLPEGREGLPPGVAVQTVLTDMRNPVAMAFDPQGRLFYTEKSTGEVRMYANGALQPNPVITFSV